MSTKPIKVPPKPLFKLGATVSTPGCLDAFAKNGTSGIEYLARHVTGDWGDVCEDDKKVNDDAVKEGDRILSAYTLKDGTKFWIITEGDRSVTTFLLPSEY